MTVHRTGGISADRSLIRVSRVVVNVQSKGAMPSERIRRIGKPRCLNFAITISALSRLKSKSASLA